MIKLEEIAFLTMSELDKLLKKLSLQELYSLHKKLILLHKKDKSKPYNLMLISNYLKNVDKNIRKTIANLQKKIKYNASIEFYRHKLFDNLTLTLYPIEKKEIPKISKKKIVHRPILEIEIVDREAFARCYLGLYSQAGNTDFKDITSDDNGNITLKDIDLMNLGNPFKVLLWCEDYLSSEEHFINKSDNPEPKPVVRSFLVPLSDVEGLLLGTGEFENTRPLDQDRGTGQFGTKGNTKNYKNYLNPLKGSLVSFFHDPNDFAKASTKGQKKYGLVELQKYLTGHLEDPRKITTKGIAAQHGRGNHEAIFNTKYSDVMMAYYTSVDTTVTKFTSGKKSKFFKTRKSHYQTDLSKFALPKKETFKLSFLEEMEIESLKRLRTFLKKYKTLEKKVAKEASKNSPINKPLKTPVPNSIPKKKKEKIVEKADPSNQYKTVNNQKNIIRRSAFKLTPNPGGGDCLYHAVTGQTLTSKEILTLRQKVACIRSLKTDNKHSLSYNANIVAAIITQTPALMNFEEMVIGRTEVPNAILAQLQSVPGVYAGPEELIQWCDLDKKKVCVVVEQNGTVMLYDSTGEKEIFKTEDVKTKISKIQKILSKKKKDIIILYKSPVHWERIVGMN